MSAITTAGTVISVLSDTTPGTYDEVGFEALSSWLAVGEITDAGEFGRQYNLVTHNPIGDRRTVKKKGAYNDGQLTLQVARDPSDTGQADLVVARASDLDASFRIVLQDSSTIYFTAQVLSYTTNLGSVDQIVGSTIQIEISGDIIEAVTP